MMEAYRYDYLAIISVGFSEKQLSAVLVILKESVGLKRKQKLFENAVRAYSTHPHYSLVSTAKLLVSVKYKGR